MERKSYKLLENKVDYSDMLKKAYVYVASIPNAYAKMVGDAFNSAYAKQRNFTNMILEGYAS